MRPAPPPARWAPALAAWLGGDPQVLRSALSTLTRDELADGERLWWELSTLCGEVVGALEIEQGAEVVGCTLTFRAPTVTGGAPRRIRDVPGLLARWAESLEEPPSIERHRRALLGTATALRAGMHPLPDAAFALLRHHSDLAVDMMAGRELVGPPWGRPVETVLSEVETLQVILSSPSAFQDHVREGADSPSLARRDLSWRLLQLARSPESTDSGLPGV